MKKLHRFLYPLVICVLCLAVCLTACQKTEAPDGPLTVDELALYESLYGQPMDAVLEGLGLSEKDLVTNEEDEQEGKWTLTTGRTMAGQPCVQYLLFDVSQEEPTLYSVDFRVYPEEEEVVTVVQSLWEQAKEIYGEPATYLGLHNVLADEDNKKELEEGTFYKKHYLEDWTPGDNTMLRLDLHFWEDIPPALWSMLCQKDIRSESRRENSLIEIRLQYRIYVDFDGIRIG